MNRYFDQYNNIFQNHKNLQETSDTVWLSLVINYFLDSCTNRIDEYFWRSAITNIVDLTLNIVSDNLPEANIEVWNVL